MINRSLHFDSKLTMSKRACMVLLLVNEINNAIFCKHIDIILSQTQRTLLASVNI